MGNSIVEKLKLQKYKDVVLLYVPEGINYFDELTGYKTNLETHSFDLIFAFVLDMESLKKLVKEVIENNHLNHKGYLYIAYPKKGNKVYPTYIHRDDLLEGLGADEEGYVDNSTIKFSRMVGLDNVFTVVGLKEDAKLKNMQSSRASQSVDDYINFISQIEKDLEDSPNLLSFYKSLTIGYQKDWARYVYSAKQEATKEKRREEMKMILDKGYKTKDLYRQNK